MVIEVDNVIVIEMFEKGIKELEVNFFVYNQVIQVLVQMFNIIYVKIEFRGVCLLVLIYIQVLIVIVNLL